MKQTPIYDRIHLKEWKKLKAGDHVIVQGDTSLPTTTHSYYILLICDIWKHKKTGKIKFTGRYYYFPRDIPQSFHKELPESGFVDNELCLSSFTADNDVDVIISKCEVVKSSVDQFTQHQNRIKQKMAIINSSLSIPKVYICRYQFNRWNLKELFSSVIPQTPDSGDSRIVLDSCNAEIPELLVDNACDTIDQSTLVWKYDHATEQSITVYLFLVQCLQLAVGNIVALWNYAKKGHDLCVIMAHNENGTLCVKYHDRTVKDNVLVEQLRGHITEEMALSYVTQYHNDTSKALLKCALVISVNQSTQKLVMEKKSVLGLQRKKRSNGKNNSPFSSKRQKIQVPTRARGTRTASLVALQRIFSNA